MSKPRNNLFDLCSEFIDDHTLRCEESIYQRDIDEEAIRVFLVSICEIVGYFEDEEE